jgi:ABC transporter DrrB family efflux protein
MKKFLAIFKARNLEFFRDKGTFIWNLIFPLFLIFGFYFIFSGDKTTSYKIGIIGKIEEKIEFTDFKYIRFIPYKEESKALDKLSHHQIDMVLDFNTNHYYINEEAPNGYITEKILQSDKSHNLNKKTITGKKIRYIDWFIPGVIGMNIMFGCLIGVGFIIVRYRKNGVLKRFKATPLSAFEFIAAQMFSRFFIMLFMSSVVYTGTNFLLKFMMQGSYLNLLLVTGVAIFCLISLGLLFSTRIKSEEFAGGLINMCIWPMMFFSGIWFSLEGTPRAIQTISKIFPVTHFLEAAREIMLDGASLAGVMDHIFIMLAMTGVFLVIAAFIFKWE